MSGFFAAGVLLAVGLPLVASVRASVGAPPLGAEAGTITQQDEAAVRTTFSEIVSAFNAHDAKRWAALMDPSFVNWAGSVRSVGEEERFIAAYFGRQQKARYRQLDEIGVSFLTPDVALYRTYGEVSNAISADGQVQPPSRLLEAWLLRKRGDTWRVAVYFTRPSPQ